MSPHLPSTRFIRLLIALTVGAIVFTGPALHQSGIAGQNGNTRTSPGTLALRVIIANQAPTLDAVSNPVAIPVNAGQQTVNLAGISAGPGETQALIVTATSGNTALIPNPTVTYTSPNATGSLSYTPVANTTGTAVITVRVTDNGGTADGGVNTIVRTFTVSVRPPSSTSFTSSRNPSDFGEPVTFTATVTSSGNPVTQGNVIFREGATVLSGPTAANVSGQASFTTSTLNTGSHTITADYGGTFNFPTSSGSVTQFVDCPTTHVGNTFTNSCPITLSGTGPATPYPSHIFVSGLSGTIASMTVTLNNVTHGNPDDIDIVMDRPGGGCIVLISDAGGTTPVNNVTVTFDDNAASTLGDNGGWGAQSSSVSSHIVDYAGTADVFPAPAPAGPHPSPGPTGNATLTSRYAGGDPNGTWSLYVVDDPSGSIAGGWSITFQLNDARLPVELASFNIGSSDRRVFLDWRTASEINNAGFEVQRARPGADTIYHAIASYLNEPELVGLGTNSRGRSYSLVDDDASLQAGSEYLYRLVDVTSDGIRTEHEAKRVRVEAAPEDPADIARFFIGSLSPNPVSDDLQIEFYLADAGVVTMEIFSSDGSLVSAPIKQITYSVGEHRETVHVDGITPGTYTLRLMAGSKTRVQRFVIMR